MRGAWLEVARLWLLRQWALEDLRRYSAMFSGTGQRESMQCQHVIAHQVDINLATMTAVADSVPLRCDGPVTRWRQCGNGCRIEIGYCDWHGGDARAAAEMSEHNITAHVPAVLLP